ncbi:MAG TPA: hypothetical protein VGD42_22750 [Lysobacter sp.]
MPYVLAMNAARWILLIWLCSVLLSTLVVSWVVLWHRMILQNNALQLRAAFDALPFDTPTGRVKGDTLTVVKIAYQLDEDSPSSGVRSSPDHWDSVWYAIGPGPSYFRAICMFDAQAPARPPQWRVRALDESRMRAALSGDRRAEMLAFGEAIEA